MSCCDCIETDYVFQVITLMIQSANFVNARENMEYRRSYQPRNNVGNSDYMMKSVR